MNFVSIEWLMVDAYGNNTMGLQLKGLTRCPQCGISSPLMNRLWASAGPVRGTNTTENLNWGAYSCSSCAGLVLVNARYPNTMIEYMTPTLRSAASEIPDRPRRYLQQAYDTMHAPDACAVVAGSAVDAMLKCKGYDSGSLYARIQKALNDNVLTKGMADWAHAVRLEANNVRHADIEEPHVSAEEARELVTFAEALGQFLFVLADKVAKGIEAASDAKNPVRHGG